MVESPVTSPVRTPAATAATPPAAYVAAGAFLVEGVVSLVHHTGDSNWDALSQLLNAAYGVAVLAVALALPRVGRLLGANLGGRVGIVVAQLGLVAMAVESAVSAVHKGNTLGGLFFGGLLAALLGLLVLGVVAVARGPRRSVALLPFLGMLVGIAAGEHGGGVVTAAMWLTLGIASARELRPAG